MYFPGDPLLEHDPIFAAIPDPWRAGGWWPAVLSASAPAWALAYRFDVTLGGREARPGRPHTGARHGRALRTPSQTVGPVLRLRAALAGRAAGGPAGNAGRDPDAQGRLLDGRGAPMSDGLVESWQASQAGATTMGSARLPGPGVGAGGRVSILKQPALRAAGPRPHAPHLAVSVFARGLVKRLVTRDLLRRRGGPTAPIRSGRRWATALRATLVARADHDGYRFDIQLQGAGETVFFDV